MASKFNLVMDAKIVQALNAASDTGRTSEFIILRDAHKVFVVVNISQATADQVTIGLGQALDVVGTGAKDITTPMRIYVNEDQSQSDTLVAQPMAATYQTARTEANKKVVFEIVPESNLDLNNGFQTIAVETSGSVAATITQADFFVMPDRYAQATPNSVLS